MTSVAFSEIVFFSFFFSFLLFGIDYSYRFVSSFVYFLSFLLSFIARIKIAIERVTVPGPVAFHKKIQNSRIQQTHTPIQNYQHKPENMATAVDDRRTKVLADYRKRLLEHRELEAKVKEGGYSFPPS